MANNRNNNKLVVPAADNALNQLKLEIASELGIENYDEIDKGALPARVHGAIGGSLNKALSVIKSMPMIWNKSWKVLPQSITKQLINQ